MTKPAKKLMRLPTDAELEAAVKWLELNEGPDGEAEACKRVADWVRHEVERRALITAAEKLARVRGVSVAMARRMIMDRMEKEKAA